MSLALPARADLTALVAASRPSVLPVGTYNPLNSPRFSFRGSGFVVGDGNLVITNAHVLPESGTTPEPQLAVLVNERRDAGSHAVPFNAAGLRAGMYFYRLGSGSRMETK